MTTSCHPGRLVICIADVAGKGAKAAMIMAVARTAFRAASDSSDDPGVMLRSVSRVLNQTTTDTEGSFVTMLALTIDRDGRLLYANAGHPSGVVITRDGMVASCADSTGTLVGIDARGVAGEHRIPRPARGLVIRDACHRWRA